MFSMQNTDAALVEGLCMTKEERDRQIVNDHNVSMDVTVAGKQISDTVLYGKGRSNKVEM